MNASATPLITIDTNCVVGLLDRDAGTATSVDDLRELIRYALSGTIQVSITTRVETDFGRDRNADRRAAMLGQLGMFPIIGSVFRIDGSRLDDVDALVGAESRTLWREVQGILFPGLSDDSGKLANKLADIDHLVGHKLAGRDVFVTDDRDIVRRYAALRDGPGVLVMNPAECVRYIDAHVARHQRRMLTPKFDNAAFRDTRLRGDVTFDYASNDHVFTIGDGLNMFDTQWSKASDSHIHAYRDSASIDAIALPKDARSIAEVGDASVYDFSSRSRMPGLGQVVVWRNVNGFYAATRITGIRDDTRGAERDELSFEFAILPDGSCDFTSS